ncbi:FtsX-like permease family protein [Paucibacter sp. R3-3]|uniref:FtsX-like permease family protein n=1 Tax=Roseateles agri TaxID=3098619 RepID=A0ABU5DFM8_9BURK|nr:ABC transporter permease [Paucibacter sp. R3-3]MDY0745061.1 FtsX-like permease family protein [Paucibacter sp. R3-3]
MDILPILSTLKRHKTAAGLIVLQIALTCAIVCNALFLISERIEKIGAPSYMPDNELIVLGVSGMKRVENPEPQTQADLAALRAVPGVASVTVTNQMPFGGSSNNSGVRIDPDPNARAVVVSSDYQPSPQWLETFGLKLKEGRDFTPQEYQPASVVDTQDDPNVPSVILNADLAERLFPGQSALGKAVYIYGKRPQRVVGVLEHMVTPNPGAGERQRYAMVLPIQPSYRDGNYLIRVTDPARREAVLKAASAALASASPGAKRILRDQQLMTDLRSDYYRQDRTMVWLLGGVCVGLLVVTAFGIVGLASFWVQQRTRMIGTRRALGATRGQILRYFQTENFMLSTLGIVLGMAAAYGISAALMRQYELPRLPLMYLPIGALILWALGQIAVWGPARRAAALPPVAALRS